MGALPRAKDLVLIDKDELEAVLELVCRPRVAPQKIEGELHHIVEIHLLSRSRHMSDTYYDCCI